MTTDKRYVPPLSPPLHPGPVEKSDTSILSPDAVEQAKLTRWDQLAREAYFRVTDALVAPGADSVALICREYMAIGEDRRKLKEQAHELAQDLNGKSIAHRQALDQLGKVRGELAELKAAVRKLGQGILDMGPGKMTPLGREVLG